LAAPKRDFKGLDIKKTDHNEKSTAQKHKKKNQPGTKNNFSMSVQDMLAEGERTNASIAH
jgi:hypothetical protein